MKTRTLNIRVNGPAYYGAPYPSFDKKQINESEFAKELRFKYYDAIIEDGTASIRWLSQEEPNPSKEWDEEVKRAFKANGYKGPINVKFGSRDTDYINEYVLNVV